MRIKVFFWGVPIGLCLSALVWFFLVNLQLGVPSASSQWVDDVVQKKHALAQQVHSEGKGRLFFVGGSNVLFGIHAGEIENELGVETINYGLSAVMTSRKIFAEAKKSLREGDTVVTAMEYSYYRKPKRLGEVELDYMMAHDVEGFQAMPLRERLEAMLSVNLVRLIDGLWSKVWGSDGKQSGLYQATSIDAHGDETSNDITRMPEAFKVLISHISPIHYTTQASEEYWLQCKDFMEWCKSHHIRLFASFPSFLYFDEYTSPQGRVFFEKSLALYQSLGIQVLGDPFMFMYPKEDMYDTRYHLNSEGREKRTKQMIELLKRKVFSTT